MGDRGNIYIQEHGTGVYLYSHWGGTELPEIARKALSKKERWNDAPYLARIVFAEMTKGDVGNTGYGIWAEICDNEHAITVLNVDKQQVEFMAEDDMAKPPELRKPVKIVSFKDFILQKSASYPKEPS